MFNLRTIQDKVEKSSKRQPLSKANTSAKRKRKDSGPKAKMSVSNGTSSQGQSDPHNTATQMDINKNRLPGTGASPTTRSATLNTNKKKHAKKTKKTSTGPPTHQTRKSRNIKAVPVTPQAAKMPKKKFQSNVSWVVTSPGAPQGTEAHKKRPPPKRRQADTPGPTPILYVHPTATTTNQKLPCDSDSEGSWVDMEGGGSNHRHHTYHTVRNTWNHPQDTPQEHPKKKSTAGKAKANKEKKWENRAKQCLVGNVISVTSAPGPRVVVALEPKNTTYLQGAMAVRPLIGTVEVLGYTLRQGQSKPLLSLPSSALLGITAVEGCVVDPADPDLAFLSPAWLAAVCEKNIPVALFEVQRHVSPRVKFLSQVGWRMLGECREWRAPWTNVGTTLITRKNCHDYFLTHISPEWSEVVDTIATTWRCGSVPRVVVCGGKGVGKSTFYKYLANSLLGTRPDAGVLCMDLDPGQPELSVPTSLSLTHLTKPLLGPAYTHTISDLSSYAKQILVGVTSPQFSLHRYMATLRELFQTSAGRGPLPLLVNTMGWTQGTGLAIMLDVLRLTQPTHVVQIQGTKASMNYTFELHSESVMKAREGIVTEARGTELHYSLCLLQAVRQGQGAPHVFQPRVLRELRVLSEVGQFIQSNDPVKVPWNEVALHVCGEQIPRERLLQVLNGQLVALCQVEAGSLHTLRPDLPKQLEQDSSFGDLLGWGVVMGIDPLTRELHVVTSLTSSQVKDKVNTVIVPKMHLPASIYKLFCTKEGPYLQEESRDKGSKLRKDRQIKPRGRQEQQ